MSNLREKRQAVEAAVADTLRRERANSERRVYLLPVALVSRVLDYQLARLLPSEVAAVRELLDAGLEHRGHPNRKNTP